MRACEISKKRESGLALAFVGLAAGVVFATGGWAIRVVNQNVIVASSAEDAIYGFAELSVLGIERVIRFGFGS